MELLSFDLFNSLRDVEKSVLLKCTGCAVKVWMPCCHWTAWWDLVCSVQSSPGSEGSDAGESKGEYFKMGSGMCFRLSSMALLEVVSGIFSVLLHHVHDIWDIRIISWYRDIRKVNSVLGCPIWSVGTLLPVDVHVRSLSYCFSPELSVKVINILMLLPGNKSHYTFHSFCFLNMKLPVNGTNALEVWTSGSLSSQMKMNKCILLNSNVSRRGKKINLHLFSLPHPRRLS